MRAVTGPKDLPWARRSMIDAWVSSATAQDLREVGFSQDMINTAVRTGETMTEALGRAELFWVTAPMTELALDAAIDIPDWTVAEARPSAAGLIWWAGQLPPVERVPRWSDGGSPRSRLHSSGIMTRPSAVSWHTSNDRTLLISLLAAGTDVDPDAEAAMLPIWVDSIPLEGPPVSLDTQPESAGVIALLGSTWRMMLEPQVAAVTQVPQPRKDLERARRAGIAQSDVTTVDLRRIRHVQSEPEGDLRHLTVRHYVRGHWRQQWMGSSQTHEPRYIAPYIKGPEGAPLRVKERVMVWRR